MGLCSVCDRTTIPSVSCDHLSVCSTCAQRMIKNGLTFQCYQCVKTGTRWSVGMIVGILLCVACFMCTSAFAVVYFGFSLYAHAFYNITVPLQQRVEVLENFLRGV